VYSWARAHLVFATGAVALLLSLLLGGVGLALYGASVGTNLLAGACDLLMGIAVATFVIDRVNRVSSRRQWEAAYRALHGLLAASFIDVMRLVYVYSSAEAHEVNISRYADFVEMARMHVDDLRGTMQGFSAVIDPSSYALCRTVERRLAWLVRVLSAPKPGPASCLEELRLMAATGKLLAKFIAADDDQRLSAARDAAEAALRECGFAADGRAGPQEVLRYRMLAQTQMITDNPSLAVEPRGIYYDADNELAVYYFALDQRLLAEMDNISSPAGN
jgi:hypothetical protein